MPEVTIPELSSVPASFDHLASVDGIASKPFRMVSDFEPVGRPARGHRRPGRRASSGVTASRPCWASPAAARAPPSPGPSSRCSGPTLVIAPNKSLAAQLANEFREFFPDNRVEYFVSYYDYYQPEAYMAASDTYIEKDSSVNDEIDRLRHSATSALLTRRDTIVVASVSCIYGLGSPEQYRAQMLAVRRGEEHDQRSILRAPGRHALRAQRHEPGAGQVPRAGRHHRGAPGLRRDRGAHRAVRRRGRGHQRGRPAHRREGDRPRGAGRAAGHPLRGRRGAHGPGHRPASRPSCRSGSPTSRRRASCSRPSACACAPSTTSR